MLLLLLLLLMMVVLLVLVVLVLNAYGNMNGWSKEWVDLWNIEWVLENQAQPMSAAA
jgi:hypothetical protein